MLYPTNPEQNTAKAVLVSPMDEGIIKVSASATKDFSDEESMVVLPGLEAASFEVTETDDKLFVSTTKTKVEISKLTRKAFANPGSLFY